MDLQQIEFCGGPLDGLTHEFRHSPDRLPYEIGLPVNPSLVGFLCMDNPQENVSGPATSIAVYELETDGELLRYRHVCSVAEEEYQLEDA